MPYTLRSGDSRLLNARLIFSWKFEQCVVRECVVTMRRQGVMRRQGAMRRQGMCRHNASSGGPGTSPMCRHNASSASARNVLPKLRVP